MDKEPISFAFPIPFDRLNQALQPEGFLSTDKDRGVLVFTSQDLPSSYYHTTTLVPSLLAHREPTRTLQGGGYTATYGFKKSDGPVLADGYINDVTREKAAYEVSAKIVSSQQANIDSKTWWLVRDNLRGQAYNMKANMLAINKVVAPEKAAGAKKAYAKFWNEINQLDLACTKKELDLAQKEYSDLVAALDSYIEIIN